MVSQDFIEVLDYALALCEETQGIWGGRFYW